MKKIVIVSILCLGLVGCASTQRGRFSVLDLDLRTPEQITAYQHESSDVYVEPQQPKPQVETKSFSMAAWDYIVKIVEVFKGRIKIGSIEWTNKETK